MVSHKNIFTVLALFLVAGVAQAQVFPSAVELSTLNLTEGDAINFTGNKINVDPVFIRNDENQTTGSYQF